MSAFGVSRHSLDLFYETSIIELAMCWNAASSPRRFELSGEQDAIHQFVGAYYEAFARDPAAAAAFYGEPTLIVLPNEILTLATRGDVEAFLVKR